MSDVRHFFRSWMVMAKVIGVQMVLLVAICTTAGHAADLSAEYQYGRWVIAGHKKIIAACMAAALYAAEAAEVAILETVAAGKDADEAA